jgi:hypothetical protein
MQPISTIDEGLFKLIHIYGVEIPPELTRRKDPFTGGVWMDAAAGVGLDPAAEQRMLFPWRVERRLVELRNLRMNGTLGALSTIRLASFCAKGSVPLPSLLYRLLDLAEWLGGERAVHGFAVGGASDCANAILRLESGALVSIEASCGLPEGSPPMDRHELISRRGVASDRVVDTQVPQASVYRFDQDGRQAETDVDAELFGLSPEQVWLVRAGFETLRDPERTAQWRSRHAELNRMVEQLLLGMQAGRRVQLNPDRKEVA